MHITRSTHTVTVFVPIFQTVCTLLPRRISTCVRATRAPSLSTEHTSSCDSCRAAEFLTKCSQPGSRQNVLNPAPTTPRKQFKSTWFSEKRRLASLAHLLLCPPPPSPASRMERTSGALITPLLPAAPETQHFRGVPSPSATSNISTYTPLHIHSCSRLLPARCFATRHHPTQRPTSQCPGTLRYATPALPTSSSLATGVSLPVASHIATPTANHKLKKIGRCHNESTTPTRTSGHLANLLHPHINAVLWWTPQSY